MRTFFTVLLFFCLWQAASAQKWLWVRPDVNADTGTASVPWAIATDASDNIIVAGGYRGVTTIGTYTLNSALRSPFSAFMLAKYDSAGNVLWAKTSVTTAPSSWCFAYSVAVDKLGNSYATGLFFGSMSFDSYTISSDNGDVFLVKYDPNGNALWVRTGVANSSSGNTQGNGVAIDNAGNPYITGVFYDTVSFGAITLSNGGSSGNAFIVKYDANGNVLWTHAPAIANGSSIGTGLAADNMGDMYATGNYTTTGSIIFNSGIVMLSQCTSRNMYLVKYDANGNALWGRNATIPGSTSAISKTPQLGEQLTTDKFGNVTVAGNYYDSIIMGSQLLTNGYNTYNSPVYNGNVFVAKYSSVGKPMWAQTATLPNSSSYAVNYGISTDKWDNMYLSGSFVGGFAFGGIQLQAPVTGQPSFIVKLDSIGEALCGTLLNNQYKGNINVEVTGYNAVAASPNEPNVFFTGGVSGYSQCAFGKDTIHGIGDSYGFAAQWTCGTCNIPPLITGKTTICAGQNITLTASGGTNYVWNNTSTSDSISVNPSASQSYYVAISNDSCTVKDSIAVTVHPVPVPTVSANQNICDGNTANLTASGGTIYNWLPSSTLINASSANPAAKPTSTTEYTLSISNGFCTATDSTLITVNPLPVATISNDTTLQPGQSATLTASGGQTYVWSPINYLSCDTCPAPTANPLVNTTYTVIVTNSYSCSVTETITVNVQCGQLFIPQAFSPNGDGVNDVLYVRDNCIKAMQFTIYDRWGNKVFETNTIAQGWNGEHNGQPMNTGTYTYYLSATDYSGNVISKKGSVELAR